MTLVTLYRSVESVKARRTLEMMNKGSLLPQVTDACEDDTPFFSKGIVAAGNGTLQRD